MPRLAVIDAAAVDGRRRLVLVRRDNVEHLLMIGGPTDIVVEPNIVRAMPGRDQMAPRPGGRRREPPPRIAPLPDAGWSDEAQEPTRDRPTFDHPEPQMPEPPPRPARPSFADEVRRPAPPPMPERRGDPLTGFAPESISGRPEPASRRSRWAAGPSPAPSCGPSRCRRESPRAASPPMPRPPRPRTAEGAAGPRARTAPPRRRRPRPPPAPAPSSADQNLAEMAQRLEAALRRPAGDRWRRRWRRSRRPPRAAAQRASAAAPAPQKSGFENLEDEMASLLGRPKNPS